MLTLLTAVHAQLLASDAVSGIVGTRIMFERTGDEMPYLVIAMQPSSPADRNTGDWYMEGRSLLFNAYSTDSAEVGTLLEAIETELTGTLPTLASGATMDVAKMSDDMDLDPEQTDEGEDIWHGILNLEFTVQKTVLA